MTDSCEKILSELAIAHDNTSVCHLALREKIDQVFDWLESGVIRCAYKKDDAWHVDERVKKSILLGFRVGQKEAITMGAMSFVDKNNLWPRTFTADDSVRIVPFGSSVRRGSYLGNNVIVMPPAYINIGAYVGDDTMIDSHALVGSCAQVGNRVHISAGSQIGGVLEPIGAMPVIIEDDCLIGGNSGIYEGTRVGSGAVIGAGVVLTKSLKIYDLVNESCITAADNANGILSIPPRAVVVMGTRALKNSYAAQEGLSVAAPLIIKYRDEKTDSKIKLEDFLRDNFS
ncbi:MAG: 2,3,4,5-tetrahydropyridine-2,6-dicarboxylate N-succinyltransferase [Myxococcales bacterium]|nr:2,3,4,5-tetrahydropyridine-2,6-dicarboxylate N-succinyltransferase [Myxococcales bacterium]USN51386.1 MAG: 2,3,4,5-tetrahydropyridine-2,6-dicarboxylate N-succinyltransferase [Myxococcales bacterium]